MFNYIKSELYRIIHKKSNYIYYSFLIFCVVILLVISAVQNLVSEKMVLLLAIGIIGKMFYIFIGVEIFITVYLDDFLTRSLSNIISTGISRRKIIISKLIVTAVYTLCIYAVLALVYMIIYLVVCKGIISNFGIESLRQLAMFSVITFITNCAFISIASIVIYSTQKVSISIVIYLLLVMGFVYQIIDMLGYISGIFKSFKNVTLTIIKNNGEQYLSSNGIISINFFVGAGIYLILSTLISMAIFQKSEIKID